MIGMDPIMWDPFRYKLGGQLLNAEGREFIGDYDRIEEGHYRATRDVATYAILKEVAAGRGSPHGGVYLSFRHVGAKKASRGVRAGDRSPASERNRSDARGHRSRAHPHITWADSRGRRP